MYKSNNSPPTQPPKGGIEVPFFEVNMIYQWNYYRFSLFNIVNSLFRLLLRGREGIYLYKVLRKRTIDTANFLNELESKIKLISLTLFTSPFSGD